jgi:hypothetical protein
MSFAAKFGGTCSKCAGRIPAGASVNYDGKNIRHAPRCPAAGTVTELPAEPKREDTVTDDTRILGRASYKGKSGYLILWMGETKKGRAAKLAFRDGAKVFWADLAEIKIEKRYEVREYRGREEHMTFGRLNSLAKDFAAEKAETAKRDAANLAAQQTREAAIVAKMAATGKTRQELQAEADAAYTESRKGLADFTRQGKNSVTLGEKIKRTAKDGTVKHYEVVSVGGSYNHTEDECEDMDCFCGHYGWRTSFSAREIPATGEQLASEAQKQAEDAERAELGKTLRASFSADTHLGSMAPKDVTLTDIWRDARMGGSETWYAGSDGIVYHMRSDYDMGPNWWRTSATVAQIERAKALGMKVIS